MRKHAASKDPDRRLLAVRLIQRWWRRCRARFEVKRRTAWVIYQGMEFASESAHAHLIGFYSEMLQLSSEKGSAQSLLASRSPSMHFYQRLQQFGQKEDVVLAITSGFNDITVEKDYTGPHLTFPLKANHVQLLIEHFRAGTLLHARYLLQLLHETRLLLKTKPNLSSVSTSISKHVTVVGDLHGFLIDLLIVLDKNGLPDVTNPYVFNGDFVDRGPNSVEVLALLCACQLVWPTAVFLNRGNHEDPYVNMSFGFVKELQTKYKQHSSRLFKLIKDLYSWLPLASIIDNRIFVTHGGISSRVDLEMVRKLERHRLVSPCELSAMQKSTTDTLELQQVMDLLWNDPHAKPGYQFNARRKVGLLFGPDVTAAFLKRNHFSLLVRSHDCQPEGYDFCHNRMVLTIFSTSNYHYENKGAYVKFDSNGAPYFVQYLRKPEIESLRRRINSLEESSFRALRAKIASSRSELLDAFHKLDSTKTGNILITEWCTVMSSTLQMNLPWLLLRPHLVKVNQSGSVQYMTTFDQLAITHRMKESSSVTEILYRNKEELEAAFRLMDPDGSGYISLSDFKECCSEVCHATGRRGLSEQQMADMAKLVDLNKDGKIDYNEFLEAFRIADMRWRQADT